MYPWARRKLLQEAEIVGPSFPSEALEGGANADTYFTHYNNVGVCKYFFFMVLNNHTNTALNWIKGASTSIPMVTLGTPEVEYDMLLRWPDFF